MSRRLFLFLAAAGYVVVGLIAFAPVLSAGFMGDDWFFLDGVSKADSAWVAFDTWNARFKRPLVALIYYVNYRHFGLWPVPAHLAAVFLHVLNAWLVCVLLLRLAPPPNRLLASGAGLIFLLFAGHSEAIAWIAGLADAAIVPFLIGALLLFDRALHDPRPARWLAAAWVVSACGFFAKETAMIVPALAAAYGVLARSPGSAWRPRLARTAMFVAGAAAICAAYWLLRTYRFDLAADAFAGMGTSEGQRIGIARMFLLRAFVPPGRVAVYLWVHGLDVLLFAAVAAAGALVAFRDRASRPGLAFLTAALFVALAPALPLSISLATTLTERYLYAATIFSCGLTAWLIVRLVRPGILAAIVVMCVAAVQWRYLDRSNRTWVEGDRVFQTVVHGLAGLARAQPTLDRTTIVLLNMPDTIGRPFVDGTATFPALRLTAPDLDTLASRVLIVAMHAARGAGDAIDVRQDDRTFTVDLGQDTLVDGWLRDTAEYTIVRRSPRQFTVWLKPGQRRMLVARWSEGRVDMIANLPGTGLPFGSVDLPAADTACTGASLRFAGWALDDEGHVTVRVEREDQRGGGRLLGVAEWRTGTRPDVTAAFHDFPAADRAEWNYHLSCGPGAPASWPARIRVVARDPSGHDVVLGSRLVRAPQ